MKTHALLFVTATLALTACQPASDHAGRDGSTASVSAPAPTPPAANAAVQVDHAWSRATPPGAAVGGGYLTLRNHAKAADRLLKVESAASARVEIHEMRMEGDVMKMRQLDNGLELPAGQAVTLAPGGNHLMFIELHSPLVAGTPIEATLRFEHAPSVTVRFDVLPMGADAPGADASMQHHH
ncbi:MULTISPECIES: copper chaperone PCu(A)C [Xanthomonas]|uniref:Copper chaperone PCu(A)C n=1 Tax=Xanthomonas cucurbitae TaxID=56453 RepID=A0ABY7YBK1_9XANT|nr:copper chaperone PCu(A)C [Xanthomonas cucurbitae]QHG85873.1 copper chaperone PCu(A)C [Xanthomonas cucurbitae]WDM67366.1 copper chaperone PCu(A)C [Xanthomonas cucurbitae]WDM71243.1 copper chaperone PCu(A)C [Xanthomonas cucurbitae]WDM75776.1 copper chaperone PCu(A)C [Xanthomonas cucurbitae]